MLGTRESSFRPSMAQSATFASVPSDVTEKDSFMPFLALAMMALHLNRSRHHNLG